MPTGRRRRRALTAAALAGVAVLAALGVGAYGLTAGWFDEGSVTGSSSGFMTTEAPEAVPVAGSWPEFGFDAERTRSNTALRALAPPLTRRWRLDAGSLVEFPPVVGDGRVVLGTNAGLGIAADLDTGRVVWRRRLGGIVASSPALTGLPPGSPGPATPPALALFTTMRGDLVALDAATGAPRWRIALRSPIESSPLVVGDGVYLGTKDGRVVRVSIRRRSVVWTARAAGEVKGTLARSGSTVVVGDYAGTVAAYAMADGREVWRTTSPGPRLRGAGRFYAGPAVAYGRVYIGNVNARMLALSAGSGAVAWVRVVDDYIYSSAAVADRTVYVGSYDQHLYALDAVTGGVRWRFDTGERISGSPSVVGNLVWVATLAKNPADGRVYAVDARTGRRVLTIGEGRYAAAVGVRGTLVVTGVRTVSAYEPR